MTHQEIYDRLKPFTPEGMNLSVEYTIRSWGEPQWGASYSCADIDAGIAEWADTPEELLLQMFERLLQRGREET